MCLFAQVLLTSAGGTAVKADTDCTVQEDSEHRIGWNLTNAVAGTKFNLYYFNGTQEVITLGAITSIYARAFINVNSENPSIPFFHIYTKPTGVGDAGPWYHSKIDYSYDFKNTIGIGEECIFYGIKPPTNSFSNRHIQFKTKTVTGDGEDDEEILYMAFSSDSGASQDAVNVTANLLGFDDTSICRNLNLISESSLTGGATEVMQQLQLDQETVIATNTSSINTKITVGDDDQLTEAQQVCVYARKDASPSGLRALKVNDTGCLFVRTNNDSFDETNSGFSVPALGTGTTGGLSSFGQNTIGFAASSSNTTDPLELYVSTDNITFYPTGILGTNGRFYHNENNPAFNWYAINQTDTTTASAVVSYIVSKH